MLLRPPLSDLSSSCSTDSTSIFWPSTSLNGKTGWNRRQVTLGRHDATSRDGMGLLLQAAMSWSKSVLPRSLAAIARALLGTMSTIHGYQALRTMPQGTIPCKFPTFPPGVTHPTAIWTIWENVQNANKSLLRKQATSSIQALISSAYGHQIHKKMKLEGAQSSYLVAKENVWESAART